MVVRVRGLTNAVVGVCGLAGVVVGARGLSFDVFVVAWGLIQAHHRDANFVRGSRGVFSPRHKPPKRTSDEFCSHHSHSVPPNPDC